MEIRNWKLEIGNWLTGLVMLGVILCMPQSAFATATTNLLITDINNARIIEVNPNTHNIIWQYGITGSHGSGTNQLMAPYEATFMMNGHILIADEQNHRVIEIEKIGTSGGNIIWQYGQTGVSGSGENQLYLPFDVKKLPNGNVLITDRGNNRVIEVTPTYPTGGSIIWSYGLPTSVVILSSPTEAERLPDGTTLIIDGWDHDRIIRVNSAGTLLWEYRSIIGTQTFPIDATALLNGNILITEIRQHRVIEVQQVGTNSGTIIWQYGGISGVGVNQLNAPYEALRMSNGNTLIVDTQNNRVIEVKTTDYPNFTADSIVWQQGGIWGSGWNQLKSPVDVEEIWQGILNQVIVEYKDTANLPRPVVTAWVFTPVIPPIVEPPVLEVRKTVYPIGTQNSGTELTYTITYFNTGQGIATNVVFTDRVPAGTNFVSESAIGAGATITYSVDGTTYQPSETTPVNFIRWTFSNIGPGGNGTLQFKVIIQ